MTAQQQELISIIVPVYNVQAYLRPCLESLVRQTWRNLDIILVNDGSTDDSGRICDEFAASDARVRVIHKKNAGVSSARNEGIDAARGEYIGFVDSDDLCEPEMFEKLCLSLTAHNVDITLCGYNDFIDGQKYLHEEPLPAGYYSRDQIIRSIIGAMVGRFPQVPLCALVMGSMCRCLFRKSIINRASAIRLYNIKMAEDLLFVVEYLSRCHSAYVESAAYYHYRANPKSATRCYMPGLYETITSQMKLMKEVLQKGDIFSEEMAERMEMTEIYNITSCISNECRPSNQREKKVILETIRKYREHPCFQKLSWKVISRIRTKEKYYYVLIKWRLYRLILRFCRR